MTETKTKEDPFSRNSSQYENRICMCSMASYYCSKCEHKHYTGYKFFLAHIDFTDGKCEICKNPLFANFYVIKKIKEN